MVQLSRRITTVTIGLVIGTVLVCAIAVFLAASSSFRANLDDSILQLARTEIASATDTGYLHVHETSPRTLKVAGVAGYEKYVWIEDGTGRRLAATSNVGPETEVVGTGPFLTVAKRGFTVFGDVQIDGKAVRAVFYPFEDQQGTKVFGIVGIPSGAITTTVEKMGAVVLGVGLLAMLVGVFVAVLLSKYVADPLRELAQGVDSVDPSHGEMGEVKAPYEEVSSLATAFNQMVGRVRTMLSERQATIERQRRFVADTSHELRTPVSNLRNVLDVTLRRERTVGEYREALEISRIEVDRMSRLVQDLLDLAKSDSGELSIERRPCDLGAIVRTAVKAIAEPRVPIEVVVCEQIALNADEQRIRQAVDNLLRNALTHAKSLVRVSASAGEGDLSIEVANDGPPISEEDRSVIFERFRRLDTSRNRDTGGSGLGLAIVQAIAEGHGGGVDVSSSEDWTRFTIRLPMPS